MSSNNYKVTTNRIELTDSIVHQIIELRKNIHIKEYPTDKIKVSSNQIKEFEKKIYENNYEFSLNVSDLQLTKFKIIFKNRIKEFLIYNKNKSYLVIIKDIIEAENKIIVIPFIPDL